MLFLIDALSPTEYSEKLVSDLQFPTSKSGQISVHCLSLARSLVAVDGSHY